MIRPYVGEYLVSPVPVHVGLNRCSHNCWYCFANANQPGRRTDMTSIVRLARAFGDPDSTSRDIALALLKKGHPVLLSNDCDPFAASNRDHFRRVFDVLNDLGIPICFQTKGGAGCVETLSAYRPTMVYVSITSDDDGVSREIEPGAPPFSERMEVIRAIRQAGHHVVIGINPYHAPYWRDIYGFLDDLAASNLRHVWFGELHLSYQQVANIAPEARERNAAAIKIAMAKGNRPDAGQVAAVTRHMELVGINWFSGGTSSRGGFWDAHFALGYPFFPTLEGFFDHLRQAGGGRPVAFGFDYFDRWADALPGHRHSAFKDYLNGFGRSIRNAGEAARAGSFSEVHALLWRILDYPTRLRHDDLSFAISHENGEMVVETHNGRDLLVYAPGHDELTIPLAECGAILT